MLIQEFPSGPFETNSYIVACPETHQAIVIDPAPLSTEPLVQFLNSHNLKLTAIWLTHSHWDHIAGIPALRVYKPVEVHVHPLDQGNLNQPGSDGLPLPSLEPIASIPDFEEGSSLQIGNLKGHVIHTPGHTPGSVCFYFPNEKVLFTGDTLFKGSIGNLSFPTAKPHLMWPSLKKLELLPPETRFYPGHGPMSQLKEENWLPRARALFSSGT